MGIAFGILAGVGVLMVAMSLFATPLPASSNGLARRLDALSPSLFGDDARQARPLLDRLVEFMFGASGARLGAALNRRQADELRLKLAGWPKPYTSVESLYTYKIAISIWMGLIGSSDRYCSITASDVSATSSSNCRRHSSTVAESSAGMSSTS